LSPSWAYYIVTWNGARLQDTLDSIPPDGPVHVHENRPVNWPLAKCWNAAVDMFCVDQQYDCVIVMNDDVVFRHDTGANLANALLVDQYRSPEIRPGPEALLVTCRHANHGDMFTDEVDWGLLGMAEPCWQPGPDFSAFCCGLKLRDVIGRFDEGFHVYWEDNDTHRRIQLAGYEGYAVTPYWHFRSMTTRTDPARKAEVTSGIFEASRRHYIEKWGGGLGEERFATPYGR